MSHLKVHCVLITTDVDLDLTEAFLFQAARHYSNDGHRVLYLAPKPLLKLPMAVNDDTDPDGESMRLITLSYHGTREELLTKLSHQIETSNNPVKLVILQNMDQYVTTDFHAATVAAALNTAAASSAARRGDDVVILVSYRNPVPLHLLRNFFQLIWCIHRTNDKILLKSLHSPQKVLQFSLTGEDGVEVLHLDKMFQEVFSQKTTGLV